ncbi:unnamed protein product [Kuraishia capsulata CBS 1993]|uniref:Sphingolipid delta(4)-desaturase n=1 Tax=Kuraishia capsulata CBS 1993 TaxID=1382522 RepID=W6MKG5_9ASCO|nr:uncharacterized protein KUCA_T00001154001 [Kuraishia capsulata CBS 1993]CDK25187.1 unnamed protein product [Kuraishia capsulata CBS 1993]
MSVLNKRSNTVHHTTPPALDTADLGPQFEFYWTREKDPHSVRRKQIIAKHPEVLKLCGHEPKTKWISLGVVLTQLSLAYALRDCHNGWLFFATAYIIGATANQNCFLVIHELCHNLGFKKPLHNKLFSIVSNIPIGIPYSASFQPYHQLHHKFLGDELFDTDLPTHFEALVLSNVLGKAFFATFQIFFYALRPMFITQIKFTYIHLVNVAAQIFVDYLMVTYWGWKSLGYLVLSSFLAGSLHPSAGHFVAEHYLMDPPKGYRKFEDVAPLETYSYYGILNFFTWNVGYHNEHHDFPFVAWSQLPKLREIASEFYDGLPQHESWCLVIWNFVFDKNVLMYNRVKRQNKDASLKHKVKLDEN